LQVLVEYADGSEEVVELLDDLGLDVRNKQAIVNKLVLQGLRDIKNISLA
jgi:hypothetical protein